MDKSQRNRKKQAGNRKETEKVSLMNKFLVDTSVVIDFLRKKDKQKSLYYKLATEDLFISLITHTELYSGKSVWISKTAQDELENLLSAVTILPLNTEISAKAGQIKANYNIDLIDSIIAATAITNNLELVTLNIKDFKPIPNLKIYYEAND